MPNWNQAYRNCNPDNLEIEIACVVGVVGGVGCVRSADWVLHSEATGNHQDQDQCVRPVGLIWDTGTGRSREKVKWCGQVKRSTGARSSSAVTSTVFEYPDLRWFHDSANNSFFFAFAALQQPHPTLIPRRK